MEKITAVIPAFNAEKYIKKAVMSLVNQKKKLNEILIIDDGSTDSTLEVINLLANQYKNIRVIEQDGNYGVSVARNKGIKEAIGEWILFLDADDECSELLLETYLEEMQKDSFEAIYSGYYQIDEDSKIISFPISGRNLKGTEGFCNILIRNPIITSGLMIKKELLIDLNGFNHAFKINEDVDLWVRILDKGFYIKNVESPLAFIRRHQGNTTSNMVKSHNAESAILNKYSIEYIQAKFEKIKNVTEQNQLDFITLLTRYRRWKEANEFLNKIYISRTSPSYIPFVFLKIICSIYFKDFKEAEKDMLEILVLKPDHGSNLNNLGVISVYKNEYEQANKYFTKALELHPNYLDSRKNQTLLNLGIFNIEEYKFTKRELRDVLLSYSE